jgi:MFS family permease
VFCPPTPPSACPLPCYILIAIGARIGTDVAYYVFSLYLLTYLTTNLGMPRQLALEAVLIASALQLVLIPAFGALSDRVGRRPVYLAGAIGTAGWAFAELFSTRLRYSGASLGYQLAGIPGGALAPILAVTLTSHFDSVYAVSIYVVVAVLITVIALAWAPETSRTDLMTSQ